MNLPNIIEELRSELAVLDELLIGLEKLALKGAARKKAGHRHGTQ
jgi:hypothetical protein